MPVAVPLPVHSCLLPLPFPLPLLLLLWFSNFCAAAAAFLSTILRTFIECGHINQDADEASKAATDRRTDTQMDRQAERQPDRQRVAEMWPSRRAALRHFITGLWLNRIHFKWPDKLLPHASGKLWTRQEGARVLRLAITTMTPLAIGHRLSSCWIALWGKINYHNLGVIQCQQQQQQQQQQKL